MSEVVLDALVPYGWDERVAALFSFEADPTDIPGRVVRVDRDRVSVITQSGDHRSARGDPLPSIGDWVGLTTGGPDGDLVVRSVLTRRSVLGRLGAGKAPDGQVMAANVDLVYVLVGLDRVSSTGWNVSSSPHGTPVRSRSSSSRRPIWLTTPSRSRRRWRRARRGSK